MTKSTTESPRRLGRGLEALIGPAGGSAARGTGGQASAGVPNGEMVRRIPVAEIHASPFQPRKDFSSAELQDLKESLTVTGLLQPITVRPSAKGYEVIAGERRLRAAIDIGWTEIPALVKDIDDRTALTVALVENLQRADLNPLEEAQGYARLMQEFGMTQQHVAQAVGKSRPTVANALRLLNLPEPVQAMLRSGELTLGHARALLSLPPEEIVSAARRVAYQQITVRSVEQLSRDSKGAHKRHKKNTKKERTYDANIRNIEDTLRKHLQTDVRVTVTGSDRGQLSILFYSNDDLERLLELIVGSARSH